MICDRYWSPGIAVKWCGDRGSWRAALPFVDDQFVLWSTLRTGYHSGGDKGLSAALDVLIRVGRASSVAFGGPFGRPELYLSDSGVDPGIEHPDNWPPILAAEAKRLGWAGPEGEVFPPALNPGTKEGR